eukprot:COSAG01_NODE_10965_length_2038_cov_1.301702_3_plen_115_part_00
MHADELSIRATQHMVPRHSASRQAAPQRVAGCALDVRVRACVRACAHEREGGRTIGSMKFPTAIWTQPGSSSASTPRTSVMSGWKSTTGSGSSVAITLPTACGGQADGVRSADS